MKATPIKMILFIAWIATILPPCRTASGRGERVENLAPKEAFQYLGDHKGAVRAAVRGRAEYAFDGHPPRAYTIPFMVWDPKGDRFEPNPHFIENLEARLDRETPILFLCRSGGRSARAAQTALSAGFRKVFNVSEGFEGKKDEKGHRTVNGWKNAGLPYTYQVTDRLRYRPGR